ncbi:hypothetical protein Bmyc01_61410 [Bacillus mycoides]|uniref:hypothetical protein n=1 Tax=Bacillus thuringiensis TaxID=1428 RepID=UPI000CD9293A|nr:hypothetical protein [Bacillus thuringiensis]GLV67472.1 hypothetical protein Bmyc01_61410 [Bacillus mycoides]HDR8162780.1 hypothetical protein [Bacillus cereus]
MANKNEGLSIYEALELAYQSGIIVAIGLEGGFRFDDVVVERLWETTARILLEADEQGGGEEPDRMVIRISDVVFVLFS